MEELFRQGIEDFTFFEPIEAKTVVESINLSFKTIVQMAKNRGEKEVIIFEDDILIPNENGFKYFLKNKPKDYDVYIGGSYLIDNRYKYEPPVIKVQSWVGNHCIIINERYYDTWLNLPQDKHIDTANDGLGEFYVCYPYAALQRSGWSSNNRAICNYNSVLREGDIYL